MRCVARRVQMSLLLEATFFFVSVSDLGATLCVNPSGRSRRQQIQNTTSCINKTCGVLLGLCDRLVWGLCVCYICINVGKLKKVAVEIFHWFSSNRYEWPRISSNKLVPRNVVRKSWRCHLLRDDSEKLAMTQMDPRAGSSPESEFRMACCVHARFASSSFFFCIMLRWTVNTQFCISSNIPVQKAGGGTVKPRSQRASQLYDHFCGSKSDRMVTSKYVITGAIGDGFSWLSHHLSAIKSIRGELAGRPTWPER